MMAQQTAPGVQVRAAAHPFMVATADYTMAAGMSVAEMIAAVQPDPVLAANGHVFVGDVYIPREFWPSVRPKAGACVSIRIVPMGGGGGKNPLRTILSIAVLAAGNVFGAALGSAMLGGASSLAIGSATISAATLGKLAIGAVGNLLVNAIAPPARPKSPSLSPRGDGVRESPTLFIQGARNQLRPYAPIPVVMGRHLRVPELGAKAYTETVGNRQFVRQIFIWGRGPMQVSDIKIGNTPIENFTGVEMEHYLTGDLPSRIRLYPNQVDQEDMSVLLSKAVGWVTRRSKVDSSELFVDLTFPRGLARFDANGKRVNRTVQFEIAYSPADQDDWTSQTYSLTMSTTAALREAYRFVVEPGEYDVKVRRLSDDSASDQIFDEFYWTALRSVIYASPIVAPGFAFTVLRMQATDQLNGTVDQLNGMCQMEIPDWDSASQQWVVRPTKNPASWFRYVAQGPSNKKPIADGRLNLAALQDWHEKCDARGLRYNGVIDYAGRVGDMLDEIAAAGRARKASPDGRWTVIIDEPKSVPVQHFTPRNSWGYRGEISYPDMPHALRIPFLNEDRMFGPDERIVYADGYNKDNATKFETLEVPGITEADLAYIHGCEHLAVMKLRPEVHSFWAADDHLVCTRGDLIRFSHDVPLIGLGSARVRDVVLSVGDPSKIAGVVLDNDLTMQSNRTYSLRFRLADGGELVRNLKTVVGTRRNFEFQTPTPLEDGPGIGDLLSFGEVGKETIDLVILSIEGGPNQTAQIRGVNAAPEIFSAASGPIPEWESNISLPPGLQRPSAPVILSIQTDESVVVRNIDGTYSTRAVITLKNNNDVPVRPVVKLRQSGASLYETIAPESATADRIVLSGLDDAISYDIQIFYRAENQQSSLSANVVSPPAVSNFVFVGESGRPDDVENFKLQILGEIGLLTWDAVANIDFRFCQIRFTPSTGDNVKWNSAQLFLSGVRENRIPVPAQVGTYLIKAFDRAGNESLNAARVSTTAADVAQMNIVETLIEHPDFTGNKDNCEIDVGVLQIEDTSLLVGVYDLSAPLFLGEVYTSRLSAIIDANGENTENTMASWVRLSDVASLSGADPGNWSVSLQIATTNDDEGDDPEWSDWSDFVAGDYTFNGVKFRVVMRSLDGQTNPNIFRLIVNIDMPDRTEGGEGVESHIDGTRIDYSPLFKKRPSVLITPIDMDTGDYYRITDEGRDGFTVRFYDDDDQPIVRVFNWIAKGYGREIAI